MMDKYDLFFDVTTPLGFKVYTTNAYWEYIISVKHPYIKDMKSDAIATLENPDFIRQSKVDENVYLFYRKIKYHAKNYHMCVVANKRKGFVITIYITGRIKEGVQIWVKSES